ncbi:MAG TPA: hypothetical protein VII38_09980 [Polyangia bacterium]
MKRALAIALLLAGCTPEVRFADRAILWREPDTAPIPLPKRRDNLPNWIGLRDAVFLPADRELALDYGRESANVNALDDVGDSTWFSDPRRVVDARGQLRLRALSPAEMARGAMGDEDPPVLPLTVVRAKSGGANLGFVATDARGRKYQIKIDPPGYIGMDTSTEVVVSRLAWASGWNVPAETLVDLAPGDLALAPDATREDAYGHPLPLSPADFAEYLRHCPTDAHGTLRVLASRWIDGTILGPFAWFGRRKDDPNDRVPHEDRRDLRGFGMFSMWVNNIDTLETNTLDSYVGAPGSGHLVHYQQDVGGSFGARGGAPIAYWMASDIYFAPSRMLAAILTLGAIRQPWEGEAVRTRRARLAGQFPEIGNFDAAHFDPHDWHPVLDNPAFERQTARDRYWGLKRVLAFSPEELHAAIGTGRYRPKAARRVYDVLLARREKMARAFLGAVAPLDFFRFERDRLCFDDLWTREKLGGAGRYLASGDGVGAITETASGACVALAPRSGYRIVTLAAWRPGMRHAGPPVRVHFVEHPDGRRLIGLER